jgi:hypothetical protein
MDTRLLVAFGGVYSIGVPVTWAWLLVEDLPEARAWWAYPVILVADTFLSFVWPIYWLLIRWIG